MFSWNPSINVCSNTQFKTVFVHIMKCNNCENEHLHKYVLISQSIFSIRLQFNRVIVSEKLANEPLNDIFVYRAFVRSSMQLAELTLLRTFLIQSQEYPRLNFSQRRPRWTLHVPSNIKYSVCLRVFFHTSWVKLWLYAIWNYKIDSWYYFGLILLYKMRYSRMKCSFE